MFRRNRRRQRKCSAFSEEEIGEKINKDIDDDKIDEMTTKKSMRGSMIRAKPRPHEDPTIQEELGLFLLLAHSFSRERVGLSGANCTCWQSPCSPPPSLFG